jgi:hypothetical protein
MKLSVVMIRYLNLILKMLLLGIIKAEFYLLSPLLRAIECYDRALAAQS